MEENTIFQPSTPVESTTQPAVIVSSFQTESPISPPPQERSQRPFPVKNILKGLLGLVVIVGIGYLLYWLAFNTFFKKTEPVTLTYWGLWEDTNIVKGVIDDFQRQNPTIKVIYTKQDNKDYRERLTVRTQNGTGPDVFRFHNTWVGQLQNILLPFPKDVINPSEFQNNYFVVSQNDLIKNGAIYGIPLEIDTLSLFINNEIFKNAGYTAPSNWDDFLRIAKALTVSDEKTGAIKTSGAAIGSFDNVTHAPDIMAMLMLQNGANLKNISDNPKAVSDALLFYTSFVKPPNPADKTWDTTLDQSLVAFAKGNVAMYFGYSWDIFAIKAMNPNLNFSVTEVPHLYQQNITTASYWVEGVSQKSKHQKEVLLFLKFLSQKETAEKLFTTEAKTRLFGEPYARVDLAETLKDNTLLAPFVNQAKTAQSSYFAADTYDNGGINSRMNVYLGNAVRSVLDNTSPESAAETLSAGVAQVLKQYGQ